MTDSEMQIRKVKLMGERLMIRTDLSKEELDSIAGFAEEKLRRFVQPSHPDPKKQLLLAVLHLSGELLEARQKVRELSNEIQDNEGRAKDLLDQLDEI